jgi:hypothetical protein
MDVIHAPVDGEGRAHLAGFVAHTADMKSDLALPVHHPTAFVHAARQQHRPVHFKQRFRRKRSRG